MAKKTNYDLIILGAGPAGMTAGVYAARKQIDALIISQNVGGQATWSSGIENYLGYVYISGAELVAKFEEHLRQFDIELDFGQIERLRKSNGVYETSLADGRKYRSRAVIIATGKSPKMLNVPGEKEFTGRGVTYCATCDGPLFSGMNVAVVGGGNSGLDAAVQLMKICPKVYVIEVMPSLRADQIVQDRIREADNVEILTDTSVLEISGDQFVNNVKVQNVKTNAVRDIDVKGIFIEVGLSPNTGFIKDMIDLNICGEIPVDCSAHTGLPGLYAAGDVTNVEEKQIIIAAGDGAKAALGAYSYLVRLPITSDWGTA